MLRLDLTTIYTLVYIWWAQQKILTTALFSVIVARFWPGDNSEPHIWTRWAPYDTTTLLKRNFDNFDFFDLYRSIFKKIWESSSQKICQNDLEEPVFFNLKCRARSKQELPRCPRNVISDDYRFIPLRRRKFEVIRVLDHDFRGHQSWEDQYFENVGSHLLRISLIC